MPVVAEMDCTPQDVRNWIDLRIEAMWVESGRSRWRVNLGTIAIVIAAVLASEWFARNLNWRYAGPAMMAYGAMIVLCGLASHLAGMFFRSRRVSNAEMYVTPRPAADALLVWTSHVVVPSVLLLGVVALHAAWPLPDYARRTQVRLAQGTILITWAAVLLLCVVPFLFRRWRAWRVRRGLEAAFRRREIWQRLEAGDEGIILDDRHTRIEFRWHAVERFVESPEIFLIALTNGHVEFFPKHCFGPGQCDEFRALLRRNVHRQTRGFPVEAAPQPAVGHP
jgi:hypothetical protein